jgi:hypothetical protein
MFEVAVPNAPAASNRGEADARRDVDPWLWPGPFEQVTTHAF